MKQYWIAVLMLSSSIMQARLRNDRSHAIARAYAGKTTKPTSVETLQELVRYGHKHDKKIAIAGTQYSQGGQTTLTDALTIDITGLNKVLNVDVERKQITVEAGITWAEILRRIDPLGLSILAMQSYSVFSVGGSIGVNAHGQNVHEGQILNTIISLDVMKADGSIVRVDKNHHPELFKCVVGGYGLCGIVVRATLQLTDNTMLKKHYDVMLTADYPAYFNQHILGNTQAKLHSARLSVSPVDMFKKLIAITYYYADGSLTIEELLKKKNKLKDLRDQWLFGLMRKYNWAKHYRLVIEKLMFEQEEIISRNNAMNWTLSMLAYNSLMYKDILQEYFVPTDKLEDFLDKARTIMQANKVNLLNATIRYVPADTTTLMSYAPEPRFAVVLYINVGKKAADDRHIRTWTQQLIDAALAVDGAYYLPYGLYATKEQMHTAYPGFEKLVSLKQERFDREEIFVNQLYDTYA